MVTFPEAFVNELLAYLSQRPYGEVENAVSAIRYFVAESKKQADNGDGGETESAS